MAAVVMPTTTADAQAYCEPALYPWYLSGTLDAFTRGNYLTSWDEYIRPTGTSAWQFAFRRNAGLSDPNAVWDTTKVPNGLYDAWSRHSDGFQQCQIGIFRVANLPQEPAWVRVSPPSNTVDVFDASWAASTDTGGIAYYEYALDCNWSARVRTASQGVRLTDLVRTRGTWHFLCVRAVDRAGIAGMYAMSGSFTFALIPPSISFTAPATVNAGSGITLTALLRDPSGRPIANKDVRFTGAVFTNWRTDASGNATVTLPFTSVPGTYWVYVESPADATYAYNYARRQVTVQRTIASTTIALNAPSTVQTRSGVPLTVTLLTTDGRPVPSRTVRVSLGSYTAHLTTGTDGRVSAEILSPDVSGTYRLLIRFDGDAQYGASTAERQIQVIPDTTRPSVPTISVSPSVSTTNAFTVTWPASTDTGTGVGRYEVRVNGTLYRTVTSLGSQVHTTVVRAPAVGKHTVEVQAVDRVGNASGFGQPGSFELLRQPATIAIDSLPSSVARCSNVDFKIRLTRDGAPFADQAVSFAIGSLRATARTAADGTAQATIRLDIGAGPYTATASYANEAPLPASEAARSIQVTGASSGSCAPDGGGGSVGGGGQPSGGGGQSGRGGLSVDIPAR